MPAKYVELYCSDCDAFDFIIKLRKIRNQFKIYFLQVSAEYELEEEPEGNFLSRRERIAYDDTFEDANGFLKVYETARTIDYFIHLDSYLPEVVELIEEMSNYPYLRKLHDDLIEKTKK